MLGSDTHEKTIRLKNVNFLLEALVAQVNARATIPVM